MELSEATLSQALAFYGVDEVVASDWAGSFDFLYADTIGDVAQHPKPSLQSGLQLLNPQPFKPETKTEVQSELVAQAGKHKAKGQPYRPPDSAAAKQNKSKVDHTNRFATPVNLTNCDGLIVETTSKNTQKNTKWAWNVFEQWRLNRNKIAKSNTALSLSEIPPITKDLPLNVMIETLQYFVMEARKQNGSPYPPVTLHNLCCGLLRKCREQGIIEKNFMDEKDLRFKDFHKTLDARMIKLTQQGIGVKKKLAQTITPSKEPVLWQTHQFGLKSGQSLLNTIFFYNCKRFGLRGADEHFRLTTDQIVVDHNCHGRYVEFYGKSDKCFTGARKHRNLKPKHIRHYSSKPENDERCIVKHYQVYCKLIGDEGKFYRRTREQGPGKYTFSPHTDPLPNYILETLVKTMCSAAGLSGFFTNHSGKKTCATSLFQAGIDEQLICDRTGHRSKAVREYKVHNANIIKHVSSVLDPP